MIQAAARGIIDFREAEPCDPNWWIRCRLLLNELERMHQVELCSLLHHHATEVAHRLDELSPTTDNWTLARSRLVDVARALFPWVDLKAPDIKAAASALGDAWKQKWGDPQDPAVRDRIQRKVADIMERRRQAHKRSGRPK